MKEDQNEVFAVIARAKEIVMETADAGKNQQKLLTIALVLHYRDEIVALAKREAVSRGMAHVVKDLEGPNILAYALDAAAQKAASSAKHAVMMLKVYDLYRAAGGEL